MQGEGRGVRMMESDRKGARGDREGRDGVNPSSTHLRLPRVRAISTRRGGMARFVSGPPATVRQRPPATARVVTGLTRLLHIFPFGGWYEV
jgi:hypothetical protein